MKSCLAMTSPSDALGSLLMSDGEQPNWVNRAGEEPTAAERCCPTTQVRALGSGNQAEAC